MIPFPIKRGRGEYLLEVLSTFTRLKRGKGGGGYFNAREGRSWGEKDPFPPLEGEKGGKGRLARSLLLGGGKEKGFNPEREKRKEAKG